MNKRNKIIISITGIVVVLLALLGLTYAYYLTRIQGNTNTNSISVTTANLKLVYDDGNEKLDFTNIMPGWINDGLNDNPEPKTFSVTNNGNTSVNEYAVSLEEVTNTLTRTEDLIYTLKCTQKNSSGSVIGTCNGNSGEYPKVNQMIITNSIESGYTHEYELIVNYINHETINQSIDMGSTIKGKVQIYGLTDTIDMTGIVSNYTEDDFVEINTEPKTSKIINDKYTLIGIKPGVHTIKVCSKEDELCNNPKVTKKISIEKGNEVEVGEKIVNNETIPSITVTEDTRTINVNVDVSTTSIIPSTTTSTYNPFENNTLAYNIYQNKALVEEYDTSGNSLGTKINKVVKSLPVVTGVSDGTNIEDSGLFMAEDDFGTSYFYRGTVRNNYVDFAGFTWRIVRINGDASVRLILDGSLNKICGTEQPNVCVTSAFNEKNNDNAYVGYMYGLAGVTTDKNRCLVLEEENVIDKVLEEGFANEVACENNGGKWTTTAYEATHANVKESNIKFTIDKFYEIYLKTNYESFLHDSVFCGDKTTDGIGYGKNETIYSVVNRVFTSSKPTIPELKCANNYENNVGEYSRYTVNAIEIKKNISTNGDLKYPIGLMTSDELVLAGAFSGLPNNKYYLYDSYNDGKLSWSWWTMSPILFQSNYAFLNYSFVASDSLRGHSSEEKDSIRLVINITPTTLVTSGDGTRSNPYVIE